MNQKRALSRRELLDRLYETVDREYSDDSWDDAAPYSAEPARRHPEAPLNDSIELEKKARRQERSPRAERERDIQEELEFFEFIAEKRARQRRERQLDSPQDLYQSGRESGRESVKQNSRTNRSWASCRPIFIGCAVTSLLTAGLVKGQELLPSFSALLNSNQQQTQPVPVNQPNVLLSSTPMVTDRTNSMERVAGLVAAKSTITGFADSASMTAAYYWTLQVSNSGQQNQEARMRIAVPPGVTLSRATLWVNGVPQEAAFSTTEQVTAAYTWVRDGREQHHFLSHDPLVITQESPGHLLVKAAPIAPGGRPLQLRLGFTAPLHPSSSQAATMRLPQIQESNFAVTSTQDVHLQSATSIWSNESEVTAIPDQGGFILKGNIQDDRLTSLRVNVARAGSEQFATRATHSAKGTFIVASMKPDAAGRMNLSLLKTTKHPRCNIINSEPAAVRLSTLWAYGQVEANVKRGDRFTANELAKIFRVVSSVSGATVLEQDSDYTMEGLSRDQSATFNDRRGGASGGAGGDSFDRATSSAAVPLTFTKSAPAPRISSMQPSPTPSVAHYASMPSAAPMPNAVAVHMAEATEAIDSRSTSSSSDEVVISDLGSNDIPLANKAVNAVTISPTQSPSPQPFPQLLLAAAMLAGLLFGFRKMASTQLFGNPRK